MITNLSIRNNLVWQAVWLGQTSGFFCKGNRILFCQACFQISNFPVLNFFVSLSSFYKASHLSHVNDGLKLNMLFPTLKENDSSSLCRQASGKRGLELVLSTLYSPSMYTWITSEVQFPILQATHLYCPLFLTSMVSAFRVLCLASLGRDDVIVYPYPSCTCWSSRYHVISASEWL